MAAKCKSCPKREDCDGLSSRDKRSPETLEEQNQMLNFLFDFEKSICRTIDFALNGRNAGLQYLFFKMMSNKFRDIAKSIEPHLVAAPDDDIDWDNITSIGQLSDEYNDKDRHDGDDHDQDRHDDWFSGDIKKV